MRNEFTDLQLVEGCAQNNRRFQELLYNRFSPKMSGVCLGYAGNQTDADDILQEAFIKIFTKN